jgi:hypothetical protein
MKAGTKKTFNFFDFFYYWFKFFVAVWLTVAVVAAYKLWTAGTESHHPGLWKLAGAITLVALIVAPISALGHLVWIWVNRKKNDDTVETVVSGSKTGTVVTKTVHHNPKGKAPSIHETRGFWDRMGILFTRSAFSIGSIVTLCICMLILNMTFAADKPWGKGIIPAAMDIIGFGVPTETKKLKLAYNHEEKMAQTAVEQTRANNVGKVIDGIFGGSQTRHNPSVPKRHKQPLCNNEGATGPPIGSIGKTTKLNTNLPVREELQITIPAN